ncbi:DUF3887 domain-containing protein [Actinosynnema pretiosum]|uniref:DUF3887 domain-containing protein n=1 Tax=Actinosynnema pretiosum TaxID=42197 RepID=A0A290Z6V9_9PSEU|nr:DUF3887 domain-containing protein [Actinosynnema pretiosum]
MTCLACGTPLPSRAGPGRKQQYCDSTCRSAGRRQRQSVNQNLTPPSPAGTLGAVKAAHHRVLQSQELLRDAVEEARGEGRTWQEIGEVLGTSRQAAFQRFGRPVDPVTGQPDVGLAGASDLALVLLGECVAGRFDRMRDGFDRDMRRELGPGRLATVWARVVGSVGRFERFGEPVQHVAGDITVVDVLLGFEAGQVTATVSFDREGEVAGLFFRPA